MSWTKDAENFPGRHIDLSDAAYRLNHAAIVYSNRYNTDGHIEKARLSLVEVPDRTRRPVVVAELIATGRWLDESGAWYVVEFIEDQFTLAEVVADRDYAAARQRKSTAETPDEQAAAAADIAESRKRLSAAKALHRQLKKVPHDVTHGVIHLVRHTVTHDDTSLDVTPRDDEDIPHRGTQAS